MLHPWRSPLVMLKGWDSTSQTYSKIQNRWMVMFWPPAVSVPRRKLLSFLEHFRVTCMLYRVMGEPALCCCTVLQMNYSKRTPARFHHHPSLWGAVLEMWEEACRNTLQLIVSFWTVSNDKQWNSEITWYVAFQPAVFSGISTDFHFQTESLCTVDYLVSMPHC